MLPRTLACLQYLHALVVLQGVPRMCKGQALVAEGHSPPHCGEDDHHPRVASGSEGARR